MQTQCPHCETKFRLTETQVNVADGFVRCGVCKEIFNALEVSQDDEPQASFSNDDDQAETDNTLQDLNDLTARHEATAETSSTESDTSEESRASDSFDFFDEDNSESLQHVVPEEYRQTASPVSHSVLSTVFWSLGVLLLTATLALEYIWFNRDQFNHVALMQTVIQRLCQQIECNKLNLRDPQRIELVSRNVYSHPNEKNALMVNVTMINNADFSQAYPVMQINFSDIRGGTVAARRFLPSEYLQTDASLIYPLPPKTSTSVTLEIQDPGKQAMTYEFSFL